MLNLLYGTSGSGKTDRLIESIRQDILSGKKCYLLVPEQQVYVSEGSVPQKLPANAGLYFEIVSFSKLADKIFKTFGGVCDKLPDQSTKAVIMWETLRRLSPTLSLFRFSGNDCGFTDKMLEEMAELHSNGITPEQLENAAKSMHDGIPLKSKLNDLTAVGTLYQEMLKEVYGMGATDGLLRMVSCLETHDFFGHSSIYIDSFTSFTEPEYRVLFRMMQQAESLTVALCTDSLYSAGIHFETVTQTVKKLRELAKKADISVTGEAVRPQSPRRPEILSYLSENLWNFRAKQAGKDRFSAEEQKRIRLWKCTNLYEESELVALQILELVQSGMHYGDIAIVMRNAENYQGVLDAALERYGIPYFLSERSDLSAKPLSRLILSALRAVTKNYRQQDVLTLLKTGLTESDFREISMFEEYCQTWNISGNRFTDELWNMNPDGFTTEISDRGQEILEVANKVRRELMEPLLSLYADLQSSTLLKDRCKAVYTYVNRLNIAEKLTALAEEELKAGDVREAEENLRLYQFLQDTLVGLARILPDSETTPEEFLALLTLLFSKTDLGSVPNLHDCVVIGSANLIRLDHVKTTFLLGLCEGEFPGAVTDDGLLNEQEKDTLAEFGITLDTNVKKFSSEELMYVWRAMAKPTESVILSYPARQPDGTAKTASLAFSRVLYLLNRTEEFAEISQLLCKGARIPDQSESAQKLPPNQTPVNLRVSQTSLSSFVLCPYRYYLTYTLHLRDKKQSDVRANDEGSFLHYVFQYFLKAALKKDNTFELPPEESVESLATEIIENYLLENCPIPFEEQNEALLHRFDRLRVLAILMLKNIIGEIRSGLFQPTLFEQQIGSGAGGLPPIQWKLPDGSTVTVSGIIDRIDFYHSPEDEKIYVRIIDYKTGKHEFSLDQVQTGEDIQLVLYLMAVMNSDPGKYAVGSAEYLYGIVKDDRQYFRRSGISTDRPDIRSALDTTVKSSYLKDLEQQTNEEIQGLFQTMENTVCDVAKRILSGEAGKTPSQKACKYCPVKEHCNRADRSKENY